MRSTRLLAGRALVVGALTVLAATYGGGCEVRHVELGAREGDAGTAPLSHVDGAPSSAYGCADWIDNDLNALRAGSCEGLCSSSPQGLYDLSGKLPIIAATAGRWAFCADHLGPPDAVGIEFVPGCQLFFLKYDIAGIAVRGTEAAYQADYDIVDPRDEGSPAQIEIHLSATNTLRMDVEAFRCPERVHLHGGARTVDLARLDGHGGTGNQVK